MAMIDYGAVVKKNGKIISNVKGGLFQNFTNLKYIENENYETIVDETIVSGVNWEGKPIEFSMAGNYFVLIGDEHFLIGFYKEHFEIAIDKHLCNDVPNTYDWFDKHIKPLTFTINNEITITISLAQKDHTEPCWHMGVYVTKFTYNGDNYEVLFGYCVDPSIKYTFSNSNYYQHKRKNLFKKLGNKYLRVGNYNYRKGLKFIREWTWNGLSEEQRQIIPEKFRLKN